MNQTSSRIIYSRRRIAHLEDQSIRPCRREVVRIEIFVAERPLPFHLVAFESARKAWSTTYPIELEDGTEHLAHNFGRQLYAKGAGCSISGQVAVPGFALNVDSCWVREHIGLLLSAIVNAKEHVNGFGDLHHGLHLRGQQTHAAP